MKVKRKFGWIKDEKDKRDFQYIAPMRVAEALPKSFGLRSVCPPVVDQLNLGSCCANAACNMHFFLQKKLGAKDPFLPSRLMCYYEVRLREGNVEIDAGGKIRDAMKELARHGDCPETQWPYDVERFAEKPPVSCYSEALEHQIISYFRVPQYLWSFKSCIASGYPFEFGFTVYESFLSERTTNTGIISLPKYGEQILGGHAVLCVGYDDVSQIFLAMNSWGEGWGDAGYCQFPYEYLCNSFLADDFWTIRKVEI